MALWRAECWPGHLSELIYFARAKMNHCVLSAGQAAHVVYEVTRERRGRGHHFQVVDVAVQRLLQSEYKLCDVLTPSARLEA